MGTKRFDGNTGLRDSDSALTLLVGTLLRRNIRQGTVTVGVTATKIPDSPLSNRLSVTIMNISTNIVYIGNSSVTIADGFPLYPRAVLQISIEDSVDIYGISTGDSECRILEGS